jgi:hypothetical protein
MQVLLKIFLLRHPYAYIRVDISSRSHSIRSKETLELNGEGTEYIFMSRNQNSGQNRNNIVTCRGVRVTKITGSSSDDWIY